MLLHWRHLVSRLCHRAWDRSAVFAKGDSHLLVLDNEALGGAGTYPIAAAVGPPPAAARTAARASHEGPASAAEDRTGSNTAAQDPGSTLKCSYLPAIPCLLVVPHSVTEPASWFVMLGSSQ
jgi:hypothetical protein